MSLPQAHPTPLDALEIGLLLVVRVSYFSIRSEMF
jgi:hypothetical protein